MKTLAENAVQLDEEIRKSRLKTSSNYGISKLSPASQSKRHCNLKKERAHYMKLVHEISESTGRSIINMPRHCMHHICITGVTLDDDQTNEMSTLIGTIASSATGTRYLQGSRAKW